MWMWLTDLALLFALFFALIKVGRAISRMTLNEERLRALEAKIARWEDDGK